MWAVVPNKITIKRIWIMARQTSIQRRINGMTGAYMGNSNRRQLIKGNRLGSHQTVYRQLRKSFGMSAG